MKCECGRSGWLQRSTTGAVVLAVLTAIAGGVVVTGDRAIAGSASGELDGSRWRITELNGKATSTAGDLHFEGDRADGATACNFFGAGVALADGGGLSLNLDRMTRKGCSGEAFELERGYIDALGKVRKYQLDTDTLTLEGEDGAALVVLTRKPQFALEGTKLKIVSYLLDEGLYSVKPGSKATLEFADGKFTGNTECTRYWGSYTLNGETISTKVERQEKILDPCPEGLEQQDRGIIAGFGNVVKFDRGRNLIRLLQEKKGWAVLWLAQDYNP